MAPGGSECYALVKTTPDAWSIVLIATGEHSFEWLNEQSSKFSVEEQKLLSIEEHPLYIINKET